MKTYLRTSILLATSAVVFGAGPAISQSVNADSIAPFLKHFAGTWQSSIGSMSGWVDLDITQTSESIAALSVRLTNSKFASWSAAAELKGGVLIVDRPRLKMELRLRADGGLDATYAIASGEKGRWSLSPEK